MAESLRRSLILEGTSADSAMKMTTKKAVELCRSNTNSSIIKSVLAACNFANEKEVVAKYTVECRNESSENRVITFNSNNSRGTRGNYRGNFNNYNNYNNNSNYRGNFNRNNQNFNRNNQNFNQNNQNFNRGGFQGGRGRGCGRGRGRGRGYHQNNNNDHYVRAINAENSNAPTQDRGSQDNSTTFPQAHDC